MCEQIFKICALFCLILIICTIFNKEMWCTEQDMVGLYMLKAMFPVSRVEEDEVTIFLAVKLIQKTDQAPGIKFLHPEPGSQKDEVWDPNDPDGED